MLIDIRDTIAKIIYIGSVSEKGRCVGHWGMQYKKLLKDHMNILFEFSEMLYKNQFDNIEYVFNRFLKLCKNNKDIGVFYPFIMAVDNDNFFNIGFYEYKKYDEKYDLINKIIYVLLSEAKREMNLCFPHKNNLYYLLDSVHNLPRVYFSNVDTGIFNINTRYISFNQAINYLSLSMNQYVKKILNERFPEIICYIDSLSSL